MGSSPVFLDSAVIPLLRGKTILDIGCGYGRWGALINANYWEADLSVKPLVDGVDAFMPNVKQCENLPFYRKAWLQVLPSELDGQWDTILASEIIEHIPQAEVNTFLDQIEKAAKKRVIITTPNWPAFREGDEHHGDGNKYEAHLSYISRKALKKRGYKIIGVGFGNPNSFYVKFGEMLRGKPAAHNHDHHDHGHKAGEQHDHDHPGINKLRFLRFQLESIARLFPSQATCIVAYKDIDARP